MKAAAIIGLLLAAVNGSSSSIEVKAEGNSKNDQSFYELLHNFVFPEKDGSNSEGSPILGRLSLDGMNRNNDSTDDLLQSFVIVPEVDHISSNEEGDWIDPQVADINMPLTPNNSFMNINDIIIENSNVDDIKNEEIPSQEEEKNEQVSSSDETASEGTSGDISVFEVSDRELSTEEDFHSPDSNSSSESDSDSYEYDFFEDIKSSLKSIHDILFRDPNAPPPSYSDWTDSSDLDNDSDFDADNEDEEAFIAEPFQQAYQDKLKY